MSERCLEIEAIQKEVSVINLQIKKRIKCLFSKGNSDSSNMLNSSWKGCWCINQSCDYLLSFEYQVGTITIISSSFYFGCAQRVVKKVLCRKREVGELW
jgi:tRNA A37 threonylcarbamoyladenosine dehydratase